MQKRSKVLFEGCRWNVMKDVGPLRRASEAAAGPRMSLVEQPIDRRTEKDVGSENDSRRKRQ
jgi:hypothetical protein